MNAPGSTSFAWLNTQIIIPAEIRAARATWLAAVAAKQPFQDAYGAAMFEAVERIAAGRAAGRAWLTQSDTETAEEHAARVADHKKAVSRELSRDISRTYNHGRSDSTRRGMITKLAGPAVGKAWFDLQQAEEAINVTYMAYHHLFFGENETMVDPNNTAREHLQGIVEHILRAEEAGLCQPERLPDPVVIIAHPPAAAPANERNGRPAKARCLGCQYPWTRQDIPFCTYKCAANWLPTEIVQQFRSRPGSHAWNAEVAGAVQISLQAPAAD